MMRSHTLAFTMTGLSTDSIVAWRRPPIAQMIRSFIRGWVVFYVVVDYLEAMTMLGSVPKQLP